ncbi:hypothetical protein ACWT_5748 [Actinoplanes sp. SE50]|uniref:hypothetical protein n=1 Tax=unclassified Actinoplanes TaxID=2626549 RepID=UPI00023ED4D0|nr:MULTISPECIES: hypothetical protein [unclassified Actinoplanes]AEV86766.1 hypothetical protein ACPL_5879 [Actinoplanes sp. SE50/110]ATO85163.1 hypothetical protein ACWT_5748 [Actinoplanes sp. SE50]SLM02573.1 hypothetical protein ACSP50_5855 [Actinoplanes sp. SE50/110]
MRLTAGLHRDALAEHAGEVVSLYRAPDGRLTAEIGTTTSDTRRHLAIEWPTGLPDGWTDDTRIAADDPGTGPALVVALTPDPDAGGLRTDLLPNPGHEPRYTWGYDGGNPRMLYAALVRCATGRWDHPLASGTMVARISRHPETSPLYQTISTHRGPLRLRWHDIRSQIHQQLQALRNPAPADDEDPR